MWANEVVFWIVAIAMCGAAIGVVRSKNVVHAALFLVVVLAGAAAQYLLLVAEFVAWVQVLIYIGAVVILFLFGIMLTRAPMRSEGKLDNDQKWAALVLSLFTFGVFGALLVDAFGDEEIKFHDRLVAMGSVGGEVSSSLFRQYVVPFEVVSMLLLGALVGAVVLARRD
jgi:NADH-quinone oxidoreductase subunit J